MSKVYTYMMVAVGLTFLLKFAGIPSGADQFIVWLGLSTDASGIALGTFYLGVLGVFIAGSTASIIIGTFSRITPESYLTATISAGIFTVVTSTFVSVVNYNSSLGFIYYLTYLIFVPFIISFGIAMISYWRGAGG